MALLLDGLHLTPEDVLDVAHRSRPVRLGQSAAERMKASRLAALQILAEGGCIYGLSTGAGALDRHWVSEATRGEHQLRLLRSHAASVGPALSEPIVRATILVRAQALAAGWSAVRPLVVERLLALLNHRVVPFIGAGGSVGAADLAQHAHIGLTLVGEGRARVGDGPWIPAHAALDEVGLPPLVLEGREGFALFNGLGFSAGLAALVLADADRVRVRLEEAAALGGHGHAGPTTALDPRSVATRAHPGVVDSADRLRALRSPLGGLRAWSSDRCAHQTLGALRAAVADLRTVLTRELTAASDNPTVAPDRWHNNNNANFDGSVLAQRLDAVSLALTAACVQSERRTARLLDPRGSDLPGFLIHPAATPGLDTGMMLAQYTAASLVAEMRLGGPASAMSMPTCPGEDWTSMSALAARRAAEMNRFAEEVSAVELLVAAQAADLRGEIPEPLRAIHAAVRDAAPIWIEDRILADDLRAVREAVFARSQ